MQNRYFTIGIALVLLLAGAVGRAEAKSRHFVSHYAGSAVDGVIDTDGDVIRTASVNTGIANTTLGRFVNATGPFEDNGTGTVLVVDPQGHLLANFTGTVTGTLTGVGKEGD